MSSGALALHLCGAMLVVVGVMGLGLGEELSEGLGGPWGCVSGEVVGIRALFARRARIKVHGLHHTRTIRRCSAAVRWVGCSPPCSAQRPLEGRGGPVEGAVLTTLEGGGGDYREVDGGTSIEAQVGC